MYDYPFLKDHSYSLPPVTDLGDQTTKQRLSSTRLRGQTATSPFHLISSIDRNSSDKENSSSLLSSPIPTANADVAIITNSQSANKKRIRSSNKRSLVNDSTHRLSPSTKKQRKTSPKYHPKTKLNQHQAARKIKRSAQHSTATKNKSRGDDDANASSLSIEERVKLRHTTIPIEEQSKLRRRTSSSTKKQQLNINQKHSTRKTTFSNNLNVNQKASVSITKQGKLTSLLTSKAKKQRGTIHKSPPTTVHPSKKLFLSSGLDLNNIMLGNRDRKSTINANTGTATK